MAENENKNKDRGSAIIPLNDGLVLIHRIKGEGAEKKDYYTIPGGGIEAGETIQEASIREVKEEIGLDIELTNICYEFDVRGRKQYFFVSKYAGGEFNTGTGDEMKNLNYERWGYYFAEIIPREKIATTNILPEVAKEAIIKDLDKIFEYNTNI